MKRLIKVAIWYALLVALLAGIVVSVLWTIASLMIPGMDSPVERVNYIRSLSLVCALSSFLVLFLLRMILVSRRIKELVFQEPVSRITESDNKIKSNHGLESTGAPPAAGTPETHP